MNEINKCPKCGAELPPSVPRGFCPACLLKRGLETNTVGFTDEDQAEAARRWTPPTVEQLAPTFPELDILELIGRGGMGAVYKAREKQLDRLVALKILPPEIGREEAFAQRFAREAQAMAKLGHTNIVTIHSFGQRSVGELAAGGDLYFFIMEYVDGLSLRQLLDAGTVSPKEALAIVPQICDALQYAHDRGIVHRDIKPENILLNRAGQVKIADFGLAKLVGLTAAGAEAGSPGAPGVTQAGEKVMGTPQYMAPEQIERPREVDHRADIYSLGVVFYQMLTGELPKGKFEPPSRKVLIDVRLDEVVLRALEREPARRYQQVSEVRTQVETIVGSNAPAGQPSQQISYGWEYRSKRTLWGLPLLHIAEGYDPNTGEPRQAKGIIAWGSSAKGVIAMGGRATGIVAFGGLAVGVIAFGGLAMGLIGFGGLVLAALFAYGGVTVGPFAVGGVAVGLYAQGGFRTRVYLLPDNWTMYASILFYSVFAALGVLAVWLASVARRHRPWATRRPPTDAAERTPEIERARRYQQVSEVRTQVETIVGTSAAAAGDSRSLRPARQRNWRKWLWKQLLWLGVAVTVLLLVRAFVLDVFVAKNDAVAPEIPVGSRVYVYKLARTFQPGDILAYRGDGRNLLGRVVQGGPTDGKLLIERRSQPPQTVPVADVIGKVVFHTRSTARPEPPARPKMSRTRRDSFAFGTSCLLTGSAS